MQTLKITKNQLDTLRTNPTIEYPYSVNRCRKCRKPFHLALVKLGSQADMTYDDIKEQLITQAISTVSGIVDTVATTLFKKPFLIASPRVRLRLEDVHFDEFATRL